jgi:FkbM family methyltransferase
MFKFAKSRFSPDEPFYMQAQLLQGQKNLIVFDIGAYIGEIARKYISIFPNARVYAFEPFPDSFKKLVSISESTSIKPYNYALSDNMGKMKLYINADPSSNSFSPRSTDSKKYYSKKAENIGHIKVDTVTVDRFCNEEGISFIDILKIDVEGAEIKVLTGAFEKLSTHAIGLIYVEVTFVPLYQEGCMFHELSAFLRKYDYTLFNLYNLKRARNGQLRWGNAIFLSRQIRRKFEQGSMQSQ